jgi:glycerol-3-phosphate dehydrogenase
VPTRSALWQASAVPQGDPAAPAHPTPDRGAPFRRRDHLARLRDESFDVLVVGGGITGAGVALDAASRGLRTALVERDDFASGTSSKSSKLVHGGLRYLSQRELRLVYENLAERQRLLDNAPHLVTPLPFLIPLFGRGGVVDAGVARVYRTALWLYDATGGVRIGRRHERVGRTDALRHLPTLDAERLAAGFLYWDARTDDARLTLAVVRTAASFGAVTVNHAPVTALVTSGGRVTGARVTPADDAPVDVRAAVVVNASGVWADDLGALEATGHPHTIRPAKGIHLTVRATAFPCDIAAVIPVRGDHRSIFVVSWGDHVYLGTTDTAWDGPLDDPSVTPEDVDYVLDAANAVTTRPIGRDDVTGMWAGLRPLLAPTGDGHAPSERTADLSRRHTVTTSPGGLVTVTGGKLTTYRKMAEDTVDVVVRRLGRPRLRCATRNLRLDGAPPPRPGLGWRSDRRRADRLGSRDWSAAEPEDVASYLGSRYGTGAEAVAALVADDPGLGRPLVPGLRYLAAEAVHAVRSEMACSLEDVLERRTRAVLRDTPATAEAASGVAALLAPELGWDEARAAAEAEAFRSRLVAQWDRAGLRLAVDTDSEGASGQRRGR